MPRMRQKTERAHEAARLRRLRDMLGMSQREFADEIKVAHGAIAGWEAGKRTIPGPVLKLIELYEEDLEIDGREDGAVRLKTSALARNAALSRAVSKIFVQSMRLTFNKMLARDSEPNSIAGRTRAAITRNLLETLSELKGVAMKIGQGLAFSDFGISEDTRRELNTLLAASRPMSTAAVTHVFLEEFGRAPRRIFCEWNPVPFAVASIGQVHRARLVTGEEVAVKVQHRSIIEAIDADLRSATHVERLMLLLFRGQERGVISKELRERFLEECDYSLEADNQEAFRDRWQNHESIYIPRVYREYSTRKILVTEFCEGASFDSFVTNASQADKDRAGAVLWQFVNESIFRHNMFNCDPNPGNYLFSSGKIVFLDFGCVKKISADLSSLWKSSLRAMMERNPQMLQEMQKKIGFMRRDNLFDFDHQFRVILKLHKFQLCDGLFHFTQEYVQSVWQEFMIHSPNRFHMNIPGDFVFANRLQWGIYALLARLGTTADFRTPLLDLLYGPEEPRPQPFTVGEMALLRI